LTSLGEGGSGKGFCLTDQEGNAFKNSNHLNDILQSYNFDDFKKETEDEKIPAEQNIIWIDVEGAKSRRDF